MSGTEREQADSICRKWRTRAQEKGLQWWFSVSEHPLTGLVVEIPAVGRICVDKVDPIAAYVQIDSWAEAAWPQVA